MACRHFHGEVGKCQSWSHTLEEHRLALPAGASLELLVYRVEAGTLPGTRSSAQRPCPQRWGPGCTVDWQCRAWDSLQLGRLVWAARPWPASLLRGGRQWGCSRLLPLFNQAGRHSPVGQGRAHVATVTEVSRNPGLVSEKTCRESTSLCVHRCRVNSWGRCPHCCWWGPWCLHVLLGRRYPLSHAAWGSPGAGREAVGPG